VERTRVLLHVVDASGTSGRDPAGDLRLVREEVRRWDEVLLDRPQLVAATKRDALVSPDPLPDLAREAARLGLAVIPVSAVTGEGLLELKRALRQQVEAGKERVPVLEQR
jgi:GTP-binding protein